MKLKKMLCVMIAITMLLSAFPLVVFAEQAYPSSPHNYENDFYGTWEYTAPSDANGLLVTFSEDTWVEESTDNELVITSESRSITVGDVVNSSSWEKRGDFIAIYDGNDNLVGTYDGNELAGETIFVPGRSFTVALSTDASVSGYGFDVINVITVPNNGIAEINYHPGVEGCPVYGHSYRYGSTAKLSSGYCPGFGTISKDGYALVGWSYTEGGEVAFDLDDYVVTDFEELDLYAVWCKQILGKDEVFRFNNSEYYFVIDGEDRYVMSEEDFRMLQLNLFKTYGPGPLPNPVLAIVIGTFQYWNWEGSCYGISTVTALQHYGLIDVLSMQNASSMSEMKPTEELISYINYYQTQVATSFLTENKAVITDSINYSECLKDMFNTVKNGNLVLFTFYDGATIVTSGHAVLLTGAYTDADGNHIITTYDCNYPQRYYSGNYSCRFTISPDFKTISYPYAYETIGSINWTDNFSQFKAFDIEGNTDTTAWYIALFEHIIEVFERIFSYLFNLFGVQ